MIGQTVSHYRILEKIGAGGMGVVYRARDERLDRDVALKVLPAGTVADDAARKRFRKEALTLSQLNHPNIATVHDFDTQDGVDFLVMEHVTGVSLAQKLAAGPLPEKEVAALGIQIAEALEEAHAQGIIHRDLKPGNVMITPKGRAKVLDFGLAKLLKLKGETESAATTKSLTQTQAGAGTLPYAAPEQLRGESVDARTDNYALGAVLYEMATGQRAFPETHSTRLIDSILREAPKPPRQLNKKISPTLEFVILKALEKDPEHRYQSASDLGADLKRLKRDSESGRAGAHVAALPSPRLPHRILAATIAVGLVVLLIGGILLYRARKASAPVRTEWAPITEFADSATSPALSPDGRMVTFIRGEETFIGPGQIYAKFLPDGEPVELTHDDLNKMSPKFFPDGARIAYTVAPGRQTWEVWAVPVLGGQPRRMLANAAALTWIEDGAGPPRILFSEMTGRGVQMAVVTSAESRAESRNVYVPSGTGMAHRSYLSPDHKWILLAEMKGAWLPCRLAPYNGSSFGKAVGPSPAECTDAAWSPDGQWMYFSANTGSGFHIWRQRFRDGKPEQVTSGATEEEGISFAPDGRSFVTSVGSSRSTVWVHDSRGDRQVSSEGYAFLPSLSADGKKLFYLLRTGVQWHFARGALWTLDLASGQRDRLLPDFWMEQYNISSDSKHLLLISTDDAAHSSLWLARLDGRSAPRHLTSQYTTGAFFGADGDVIFLGEEHGSSFIYRVKEDGSGLQKVVSHPVEFLYSVSPDGKWVAAWVNGSTEETQNSVMVYPLGGGSPITVCAGGCATMGGPSRGHRPPLVSWSPNEKFLYFTLGGYTSGRTYAVPLRSGQSLPTLPPSGLRSPEDVAALPGARVVSKQLVFCGPNPSVYTFTQVATHRNIYRIPVP